MGDPGLNQLLQWGISNSSASAPDPSTPNRSNLNPAALAHLLGGPSDADLLREAMSVIQHPSASVSNKAVAWDNFELLVENLDNALALSPLGLWAPLVAQLSAPLAQERVMAAWCCGTAVQNNGAAQEAMLAAGAVGTLAAMAVGDAEGAVRAKAARALSSAVRNCQPALDELVRVLPGEIAGGRAVDAGDMQAVDGVIARVRERGARDGACSASSARTGASGAAVGASASTRDATAEESPTDLIEAGAEEAVKVRLRERGRGPMAGRRRSGKH